MPIEERIDRRMALAGVSQCAIASLLMGCTSRAALLDENEAPMVIPVDPDATALPDLVDLSRFDQRFKLDIRYSTTNNFMGRVLYPVARAVAQRPLAVALSKVQDKAEAAGYGLLLFDAYRPWRVTKAMWDETPVSQREFVADPRNGSRHNRGCSIDLSLHKDGVEVEMPSAFDDFTPAAYRSYTDASPSALGASKLLEDWMIEEGFVPLANEWWHYDWKDWRDYPIMDVPLESISAT